MTQPETNLASIGLELGNAIALTPSWVVFSGSMVGRPVIALEFLPAILSSQQNPDLVSVNPGTTDPDTRPLARSLPDGVREDYTVLVVDRWDADLAGLAVDFPSALFRGWLRDSETIWVVLDVEPDQLPANPDLPLDGGDLNRLALAIGAALDRLHRQDRLHLDVASDWLDPGPADLTPLGPCGADYRYHAGQGDDLRFLGRAETTPAELLDWSLQADLGPWTDIYQASATLFRLAVGKPRSSWAMSSREARELLDLQPGLAGHAALKAAIATGLEPAITRRPATVAAWLAGLDREDRTPDAAQESVRPAPLLGNPDEPEQSAAEPAERVAPAPAPPDEVFEQTYTVPRGWAERLRDSLPGGLLAGLIAGSWPLWLATAAPLPILNVSPLPSTIWLAQAVLIALTHERPMPAFLKGFRPTLAAASYLAFLWRNDFDLAGMAGIGLFGLGLAGLVSFVLPAVLQILAFMPRWSKWAAGAAAALALLLNFTGLVHSRGAQVADPHSTLPSAAASEAAVAAVPDSVELSSKPAEPASDPATTGAAGWSNLVGLWSPSGDGCAQAWSFGSAQTIVRPDGTIWNLEPVGDPDSAGSLTMRLKSVTKNGETGPGNDVSYTFSREGDKLIMTDAVNGIPVPLEAC